MVVESPKCKICSQELKDEEIEIYKDYCQSCYLKMDHYYIIADDGLGLERVPKNFESRLHPQFVKEVLLENNKIRKIERLDLGFLKIEFLNGVIWVS